MRVAKFSLEPEWTNHANILEDFHIICASWQDLEWKKPKSVYVKSPGKDKEVVKKLLDVISKADVVVAHNGLKFDMRKINARAIFHGLTPLTNIKIVDTLKEARKVASFTSNRLDYLGKFLHVGQKIKTHPTLWLDVLRGSKKAVKEMVTYNRADVLLLKEVYLKLRPYIVNNPSKQFLQKPKCQKCKMNSLQKRGKRHLASGRHIQIYTCLSCGSCSQKDIKGV